MGCIFLVGLGFWVIVNLLRVRLVVRRVVREDMVVVGDDIGVVRNCDDKGEGKGIEERDCVG